MTEEEKKGVIVEELLNYPVKNRGKNKVNKKNTNYIPFGRLILNTKMLNENKLLIKHKNTHAPVPKLKQTPISDNFKALIQDLITTGKLNIQLQKELSMKEQELLEVLFTVSHIKEHLGFSRKTKDIDDYIHRFNVLKGGLLAGNKNPEIKNEMLLIINLLNNPLTGPRINDEDAKFLKEIINDL